MTIETILAHAPQKTFLLQGSETAFDTLLASAVMDHPLTNALSVPRFTTDHSKMLVEFINEGTGEQRIFICFFSIFSPEAAQVLLKSLEEPDRDTTIILMTPYPYLVPATIRSRTRLIHNDVLREIGTSGKVSRDALLAQIKEEFASDAEDDAATRRAKAILILDMLEAQVRSIPAKAAIIYKAKDMLFSANMPTKYVLEYAASMAL
ncbi:MAG: polymerase delta subunit [Candidatus Nomurabacteria bacterium]|jgi:DNA polymerase III delta prime subunit|nr:polymerase delta subunit [Candidatus Nomurabacteria bacterium]